MLVNRYPALLALCGVFLLLVLLMVGGCQRSSGLPGQTTAAQDKDAQVLEEIRRTGQSVEALAEQVQRQQSLEAQKTGDPAVVRDLAVARAALAEAQKRTAEASDMAAATAAVARLQRALLAISAELPAAEITQYADRALYRIEAQTSIGSRDFDQAAMELAAAYDAANKGRPAELVPAVARDLESALRALRKGDANSAAQTLRDVVKRATEHPSVAVLGRAQTAARGAQDALAREAWPVASAELAVVESLLTRIVVAPPTPEKKPETAAPAPATAPAAPAATAPATPATPPATGQAAPAAGTTPAPVPPQATPPATAPAPLPSS